MHFKSLNDFKLALYVFQHDHPNSQEQGGENLPKRLCCEEYNLCPTGRKFVKIRELQNISTRKQRKHRELITEYRIQTES